MSPYRPTRSNRHASESGPFLTGNEKAALPNFENRIRLLSIFGIYVETGMASEARANLQIPRISAGPRWTLAPQTPAVPVLAMPLRREGQARRPIAARSKGDENDLEQDHPDHSCRRRWHPSVACVARRKPEAILPFAERREPVSGDRKAGRGCGTLRCSDHRDRCSLCRTGGTTIGGLRSGSLSDRMRADGPGSSIDIVARFSAQRRTSARVIS